MLLFLVYLFAQSHSQNFQQQFSTIDISHSASYVTQAPLFRVSGRLENFQSIHCHCFFDSSQTTCLVITNGSEGVQKFFHALLQNTLKDWNETLSEEIMDQKTFLGYRTSDGETLALVGQYEELTALPHPVPRKHLTESVNGRLYLKAQERQAQNMEIRQMLDNNRNPGLIYPAGGIPYPGTNFASAKW